MTVTIAGPAPATTASHLKAKSGIKSRHRLGPCSTTDVNTALQRSPPLRKGTRSKVAGQGYSDGHTDMRADPGMVLNYKAQEAAPPQPAPAQPDLLDFDALSMDDTPAAAGAQVASLPDPVNTPPYRPPFDSPPSPPPFSPPLLPPPSPPFPLPSPCPRPAPRPPPCCPYLLSFHALAVTLLLVLLPLLCDTQPVSAVAAGCCSPSQQPSVLVQLFLALKLSLLTVAFHCRILKPSALASVVVLG